MSSSVDEAFDVVTESHLDTLRRGYEAFAKQDLDAVLDMLHPDVVVRQSTEVPWGGEFRGIDGFTDFVTGLFTHFDTHVTVEEIIACGHSAVQIGRTAGTVRANGTAYDHREVHLWRFRGGKAVSFEIHIDVPAQQRALNA